MNNSERVFAGTLIVSSVFLALVIAVIMLAVKMEARVEYGTRICVKDSTHTVTCSEITRGQ